MAGITIPQARIDQVTQVLQKFVENFTKPLEDSEAIADFLSIYDDQLEWYDHAYLNHRIGPKALLGLHKTFNECNKPLEVKIKDIIPTAEGAILEQIWIGTLSGDIVRPNGDVVLKANGKDFVCHVCMIMKINETGKITRIDEYYNKKWDDGVSEDAYAVLKHW